MRILVLEDSAVMRKIIVKHLLEIGIGEDEIVESHNGTDALRKITSSEYDLMILDIIMDGVDGIFVFKAAKAVQPNVKVIICSTFSKKEAVRELIDLGIDDFVVKPFSSEKLKDSLLRTLSKWSDS